MSEVALSIVLLAGAGLLLRSFWRVLEVRPRFNPSHLTTVQIWIPVSNDPNDPYRLEQKRSAFLLDVFRGVSTLPGVEQAAIAGNDTLPMNSGRNYSAFSIQGRPEDSERTPTADIAVVDTEYFRTMEVPLASGRNFTDSDTDTTRPVAVIDQTLARRYWPNQDLSDKWLSSDLEKVRKASRLSAWLAISSRTVLTLPAFLIFMFRCGSLRQLTRWRFEEQGRCRTSGRSGAPRG